MNFKVGDVVWVEELYGYSGAAYKRNSEATIVEILEGWISLRYKKGTKESWELEKINMRKLTKLDKALR